MIERIHIIVLNHHAIMEVNALDYVQHIIVDANHLIMENIVKNILVKFSIRNVFSLYFYFFFLGIPKQKRNY